MKLTSKDFPLEFPNLTIKSADELQNILFKSKLLEHEQKKIKTMEQEILHCDKCHVKERIITKLIGGPAND